MDKSETYIKMCEKAEEIQAQREAVIGNFYYDPLTGVRIVGTTDPEGVNPFTIFNKQLEDSRFIWLPRQDQLQEMIRDITKPRRLIWVFYDWLKSLVVEDKVCPSGNYFSNSNLNYESLEQLWLSFLMKECWNKTWNGKDWI